MTSQLHILSAGPHVTLQDGGRRGMMRFGLPASGPMDRKALAFANAALGRPLGQTAIEVSLGGLALQATGAALRVAVAGGGFILRHNDQRYGSFTALTLRPGDRLAIQPGPWGAWCVLAVAGEIDAKAWAGSTATHATSNLGGGKLAAGQVITVADPQGGDAPARPFACPVWMRPRARMHVVLGPQQRFFSADTLQRFLTEPFVLTDAYDRMGMRLRGPSLAPDAALSIPSAPISRGSVQVGGDGVAAVLMADHQTTGGYPKIATILADDLDGFAQLRPRDQVTFAAITPDQAITLARARAGRYRKSLAALAPDQPWAAPPDRRS